MIDRTQLSLSVDNSHVEKYINNQGALKEKLKKLEEKKRSLEEVEQRTAEQIKQDYQNSSVKSNPQDTVIDIPELQDRKEIWSKEFYT